MTSVEWLFEQVCNLDLNHLQEEKKLEVLEQAKQMERDQIKNAVIYGLDEYGHT